MYELHFSLDLNDFKAFRKSIRRANDRFMQRRLTGTARRVVAYVAVIASVVLMDVLSVSLFPELYKTDGNTLPTIIIFLTAFAVYYLIRCWPYRLRPEKLRLFAGTQDLVISDEGISATTESCKTFYRWKAFYEIEETPSHFFLRIEWHTGLIIPKRAFESDEQMHAWKDFCLAHIQDAAGQSEPAVA